MSQRLSSPIAQLLKEHGQIRRRLRQLTKELEKTTASPSPVKAREVTDHLLELLDTELAGHAKKEEVALFPAFEAACSGYSELSRARWEHQDLDRETRRAIQELRRLARRVGGGDEESLEACLTEIRKVVDYLQRSLHQHFKTEEDCLFPEAERLLTPEQWQQVEVGMGGK